MLTFVSNAYIFEIDPLVNTAYKIKMGKITKLRRGDLRDALMDYAMQAAVDGHVETMSLRKAARDLGVSSGAVYRHFADKDALLTEIVLTGFMEMREIFLAIRPEGSAATTCEQAIGRCTEMTRAYIHYAFTKPALWHMMFGRVGNLCRDRMMQDEDLCRYTPFDAVHQNLLDLHRLSCLEQEPTMSDVRYVWSAVHGTADLTQSGARLDSDQLEMVVNDTVKRNLRAVGYAGSTET